MRFLVYSSPRGSKEHDIERMLFKECDSFDEAMSWARHVKSSGSVAQFIEGDDGTHLVKQQIAAALKHPGNEPEV